jgi:hypothetical protein
VVLDEEVEAESILAVRLRTYCFVASGESKN